MKKASSTPTPEEFGYRFFGTDCKISNDSYKTQKNNNDLLVGSAGSGKTTIVIKNILETTDNIVCTDVKGSLYKRCAPLLRKRGYRVGRISFTSPEKSLGYDPLHYIRYTTDKDGKRIYNEQDMFTIAEAVCPEKGSREVFWERAAQNFIVCLIAFVMSCFPEEEHNLATVADVFRLCGDVISKKTIPFLDEYVFMEPDSLVARTYLNSKRCFSADRTWSSIEGIIGASLSKFESSEIRGMLSRKETLRFEDLARGKTALFIEVSDLDRTFNSVINLMYSNLLLTLCRLADSRRDGRLPRHVRCWFDDYASSCNIKDMDMLISVLRSRNISVGLILQSISQLRTVYSEAQCSTICSNADHIIYLGGSDGDQPTIHYLADRAGIVPEEVMSLDNSKAMLITRGSREVSFINKFDPAAVIYETEYYKGRTNKRNDTKGEELYV